MAVSSKNLNKKRGRHQSRSAIRRRLTRRERRIVRLRDEIADLKARKRAIAASVELGKRIGSRATAFVWSFIFDLFGIERKAPSHDIIEQWTLRLGVAGLQDTLTKDQRTLWLADHSHQIGKERVLLIIGVALDNLPPVGRTLQLEHMKVLAIVPG